MNASEKLNAKHAALLARYNKVSGRAGVLENLAREANTERDGLMLELGVVYAKIQDYRAAKTRKAAGLETGSGD